MTVYENKLGSYKTNQDALLSAKNLEEWHLIGLLDHSIDAVIVPNYFLDQECAIIAERIKKSKYFSAYPDHPSVSRLGQELFECGESELALEKQQEKAPTLMKEMRRLIHPYISPIDRLRVELDDIWSYGCHLAKLGDKKVFAGIVREHKEDSPGVPHCDVMGWGFLKSYKDKPNLINNIAANVYLKMSESGGEIVLWDEWPTQSEYKIERNIDDPASVGDSKKIGQPKLEIRPNQGDLILFNSMRIHAVKKIKTGVRMTWGCLIGYSGTDDPLVIWT
ncbi:MULTISPECIES: 2OG-Fe(II) oxygenase [Kamptonema]|uniref:2OG-Fe(II)-dependent halogenase WelO5 family protein n=1 Tax=Kamptonema TaxID=1501433 RepID=UPI0001C49968|nr:MULTISPECIES: 2OG-Fe(II) oxygenase [Kamptonema]ADI48272.1 proline dioxygenase-like protein [Kamptonema sp. PCC 6506]CBN58616.1 Proline dioxygenase-like protein [Kamptonema sp. PCC 6506]